MGPESGKDVGGAGSRGAEGADAAGSVVAAESALREVLDGQEARWGKAVAAAGASGEPVPPLEGTMNTKVEAVSAAGKTLRCREAICGIDGGRYTSKKSTKRSREVVNPHSWPVRCKTQEYPKR